MFKFIVLAVLFLGVQSRYILVEDDIPVYYIEEPTDVQFQHQRVRRDAQTKVTVDGKGNTQLQGKLPLDGNDQHLISAVGGMSPNAKSLGLAYDNVKGHGLSLSHTSIPKFGDQVTAAGNLNLVSTPDHRLDANAFVTRNMPKASDNFNTFGGGLDYMYKGKVGAGLDVARDNFHQMTDVSAMGKLNLFKSGTSSLDMGTGVSRTFTPHFSNSWEPKFLFSWSKSW